MHRFTTRSPPIADLRFKLSRISSRQEQLKIAFNQLNSQIRTGLLEAEDVFSSLAIPLMKLVGLKTVEMVDEGRFSSIIINHNNSNYFPNSKEWLKNRNTSEQEWKRSVWATGGANDNQRITTFEEQHIIDKATNACKWLMHKQKLQLMQLVHILKQIEDQVNSSQDDILQTLADHRASMQKLFHQAVTYVYAMHQSCPSNGISLNMVKLLKVTFELVGSALGSVEIGVENLIIKLADNMCNPMVEYVNDLKTEIVAGTYPSLLAIVEKMGGAIKIRSLQLDEARQKVRAVEKSRLDALSELKESEERMKILKEQHGFLLEANRQSRGHSAPGKSKKLLCAVENDAKDEKLLWEQLRKKRKLQVPDTIGFFSFNKNSSSSITQAHYALTKFLNTC